MNLEKIYMSLPHVFQNVLVTLFDYLAYKRRHGGVYKRYKKYFKESETWSYEYLIQEQEMKLNKFLLKTYANSPFYKKLWDRENIKIENFELKDLPKLPILTKETIRLNIDTICVNKKNKIISHTGGTTGKSLTVYFSQEDAQERFACLDNFKNKHGWKFGDKTAWFSGKNILSNRDVKKNRFWKTDFLYNIKYYSTFHLTEKSIPFYIENFNKYQPLFFSGFPSSITEIAKVGLRKGLNISYFPKAIFPTAESISEEDRIIMEEFYHCKVYDQYASSEGAPFITQCKNGHMHLEILSGVFEVVDENGKYSNIGELIVTPFATEATPLVRYKIGDSLEMETKPIHCDNKAPIVKKIHGRINDFIYSEERGKINLGNISNIVKYVNGIKKFQIIQDNIKLIKVLIVKDENFSKKDEQILLKELIDRLGDKLHIDFQYVNEIPRESSGKYRIIKNNIKL